MKQKHSSVLTTRWRCWIACLLCTGLLAAFSPTTARAAQVHRLHRIAPTLLAWDIEDTLSGSHTNPLPAWVSDDGSTLQLPAPASFDVRQNGSPISIVEATLTRRAAHAESAEYKIEVITRIWLRLASPLSEPALLSVAQPTAGSVSATLSSNSPSPAFLVNRVGYLPAAPKLAFFHQFLGDWGEVSLPDGQVFSVIDATTGASILSGTARRRLDVGFNTTPLPYQNVWELEFSAVTSPGTYRIQMAGFGASPVFTIGEGVAGHAARSSALGLYHQRSGVALTQPFTRFTRAAGHLAPAEVPDAQHPTNPLLAASAADALGNPRHTAPLITNVTSSLYPFVRQGPVDVSGGHHDAGDYSKYTINSAQLVHEVAFAAESFPGAGTLDNLGLPESGDGIGDLWQIARREAEFLAKLQDSDGGFYFLVYPRARRYENNVLPAQGDPQVVWPKNTAVTAAACGALAQLAGAPGFRAAYPSDAQRYLVAATNAWQFLESAIARFGRDGAYQKLTHYGNDFMHDDEMAWAAASLFAATGEERYQTALRSWMPDPANRDIRRWTWWRLYGCWGNAMRAYVFADTRPMAATRDPAYLALCRNEILAAGTDQVTRADQSALGLSFPSESKRIYSAGWYFPQGAAFDLMTAALQSTDAVQKAQFQSALWSNLGYAWGANPLGMTFVTGLGDASPMEPVSQIARNDRQDLPPSGIPVGAPTSGLSWLDRYQRALTALMYPSPTRLNGRYPLFDRHTDVFNTLTEATIVEMGQCLAVGAGLLGTSPLASASTNAPVALQISGIPEPFALGNTVTATATAPGWDLTQARFLWETPYGWSASGPTLTLTRTNATAMWLEVEAILPDGRRLYGIREIATVNQAPGLSPKVAALSIPWPVSSVLVGVNLIDDSLPAAAVLNWQQVSGPAAVDFTDPHSASTHVAVPKPGTYVIQCTASDGEFQTSTFLTVTATGAAAARPLAGVQDTNTLRLEGFKPGTLIDGTFSGGSQLVYGAQFWSLAQEGVLVRTRAVGDTYSVALPDMLTTSDLRPITVEAHVLIRGYKAWGVNGVSVFCLKQDWDARLELFDDKWSTGRRPQARVGQTTLVSSTSWDSIVPTNRWVHLALGYNPANGACGFWVDGNLVAQGTTAMNTGRTTPWTLSVGHADADFDDLRIHRAYGPWVHPELLTTDTTTLALYSFNQSMGSPTGTPELVPSGTVYYEEEPEWMQWPAGYGLGFAGYGSKVIANFPDALLQPDAGQALSLDLRFRIDRYDAYGRGLAPLISLYQGYDAQFHVEQGKWATAPNVRLGSTVAMTSPNWNGLVSTGIWHHLALQWNGSSQSDLWIDGVRQAEVSLAQNTRRTGDWTLTLGNFVGAVDEVRISRSLRKQVGTVATTIPAPPLAAATPPTGGVVAWIPLDGSFANLATPAAAPLQSEGSCPFAMVQDGSRSVLRIDGVGSHAWIDLPHTSMTGPSFQLSAWILPEAWSAQGIATVPLLSLAQEWDAQLELVQDKWAATPDIHIGSQIAATRAAVAGALTYGAWHRIDLVAHPLADPTLVLANVYIDGILIGSGNLPFNRLRTTPWRLDLGNFKGYIANVGVANTSGDP